MNEEIHYQFLKVLEQTPRISRRGLASEVGVSLGKVNYCLKALVAEGLVKAREFKNSDNRSAYFYVLSPRGIEAKAMPRSVSGSAVWESLRP